MPTTTAPTPYAAQLTLAWRDGANLADICEGQGISRKQALAILNTIPPGLEHAELVALANPRTDAERLADLLAR